MVTATHIAFKDKKYLLSGPLAGSLPTPLTTSLNGTNRGNISGLGTDRGPPDTNQLKDAFFHVSALLWVSGKKVEAKHFVPSKYFDNGPYQDFSGFTFNPLFLLCLWKDISRSSQRRPSFLTGT